MFTLIIFHLEKNCFAVCVEKRVKNNVYILISSEKTLIYQWMVFQEILDSRSSVSNILRLVPLSISLRTVYIISEIGTLFLPYARNDFDCINLHLVVKQNIIVTFLSWLFDLLLLCVLSNCISFTMMAL